MIDRRTAPAGKSEPAQRMELANGNLGQQARRVGCRGRRRRWVGNGRIETIHRSVVALGLGKVMLPAESQVDGEIALHPPVVIDEECHVFGLHCALRVDIETSAAGKSQQEGSQVGVDGTPTFVINGRLMNGAQPASEIESVVDEELAQGNVKEAKAH